LIGINIARLPLPQGCDRGELADMSYEIPTMLPAQVANVWNIRLPPALNPGADGTSAIARRGEPMHDQRPSQPPRSQAISAEPLFRLLAMNFCVGLSLAVLLVGGLLLTNPGHICELIVADRSPVVALGLLLFGFVVTLGSTVMGTAIMAMGTARDKR